MPATNPKPATPTPASPRNTSKYTNKDGSKFITVPKGSASDSSLPPTPITRADDGSPPPPADLDDDDAGRPVNRKKQKRRAKAAAKAAAAELEQNGIHGHVHNHLDDPAFSDDDVPPPPHPAQSAAGTNGQATSSSKSKKKNKKKKAVDAAPADPESYLDSTDMDQVTRGPGISKDKIWSTSNHEERERIKEFWLGLGEDERKSLVKVEKDAVLRKMKEQQKHTCSCTVCGRKRTAIEEELEGLYDAYYLELEQFANQGDGPPILPPPPPRDYPMRPPRGLRPGYGDQPPVRGRIVEQVGDDEEEVEEVYSEDEVDDEEYSDDEPPEAFHNPHDRDVADFLTFGNSLQVKGTQLLETLLSGYGNMDLGGILTVADDLLKNDGKRFIEMMEQLAERRMAREEDAREHFSRGYGHPNGSYSTPHNHPPEEEEYEEDEDEEDDYEDSQEEEYDDEEVYSNPSVMPSAYHTECCCQDQLTEEQRMEEGRRMFQIFAARMFEQRVLSAYKEKVAKERQQKLLEELEEESRQVDEQKAKKAKNAQKKKDKAAQRKLALAEEKARKEAEKAAEENAKVAAEQQRVAEQKQKAEEKRKAKEAQRKAEEDARLRKEAERQRRIHEQQEKQAEQERKAREAKERDRKLKEEQRLKDKELREQKDREAQERKDKQERDKREKEARAAKALRDAQEAADAKARARDDRTQLRSVSGPHPGIIAPGARPAVPAIPTALPQHPPAPGMFASPKVPIATPVIPMAPTPGRSRAASQHMEQSRTGSQPTTSPNPSPSSATPVHSSPGNIGQGRKPSFGMSSGLPQSASPPGFALPNSASGYHMAPIGMQSPPGLSHHSSGGFPSRVSQDPIYPVGFRPSGSSMMGPPGISAPAGRLPPGAMAPPGFDQFGMGQSSFPMSKDGSQAGHTRQSSGSYDAPGSMPIGRPAPIGRPGSLSNPTHRNDDLETKHLGSSALVDDDEPVSHHDMHSGGAGSLRSRNPFGPPVSVPFMDSPFSMGAGAAGHNLWGPSPSSASTQSFGAPGLPGAGFGGAGWGAPGMPSTGSFGLAPGGNPLRTGSQLRHVTLRTMLANGCKDISNAGKADAHGFMDLALVRSFIEAQSNDPNITEEDLLDLCDTEGNSSNGGGVFDVRGTPSKRMIRWAPDGSEQLHRAVGAPGEIGSPITGYTSMSMRGL